MIINTRTQRGYDIATALRGPDFKCRVRGKYINVDATLKYIFTARLRTIVGVRDKEVVIRPGGSSAHLVGSVSRLIDMIEHHGHVFDVSGMEHWLKHVDRGFRSLPWHKQSAETVLLAETAWHLWDFTVFRSAASKSNSIKYLRELAEPT